MREVREAADPERGEIRLAFLHTLGIWLVPELIGSYRAEHPHARFKLSEKIEDVALAELLEGATTCCSRAPVPLTR